MKIATGLALLGMLVNVGLMQAAAPMLSFDGRTLSLTAENQTFGQLMGLFQRQTGLEFDIPGELNALRLPMVEIKNLSVRDALLKVLEGSNYDYILVSSPGDPNHVRRLVIPGKSTKVSATATAFRSVNRPLEDPFGGAVETSFEENANPQAEPVSAPTQNAPIQGATPGQPGVQPVPLNPNQPIPFNPNQPTSVNPNQPTPPGVAPQQAQPQGLQPFNPFANQNNRRSPY